MTHAEKKARDLQIVELRKQGYSQTELCEMYGLKSIGHICKRYGVDGVMSDRRAKPSFGKPNQFSKRTEEEKRAYVESFLPIGFFYANGYIDCDHHVNLGCKVCGTIFDASMISVRQGYKIVCPFCAEADKTEKLKREQEKKKRQKAEARIRKDEARIRRELDIARRLTERIHACPVCGNITTRRLYCCDACMHKVNNHRKESKRRAMLVGAVKDTDIDIHELFRRDKGVCHICGGICDWNDKEIRATGIVCGNLYPSVDHVIPLAKGGRHEWENVRLAHRICNSIKRDYIPLGQNLQRP